LNHESQGRSASHIRLSHCHECKSVSIILLDDQEKPFAYASFAGEQITQICADLMEQASACNPQMVSLTFEIPND
jgi:hypothetical protein